METLSQTNQKTYWKLLSEKFGRLYTGLMLVRRILTAQEVLGVKIPACSLVAFSPLVCSRDEKIYPGLEKVKPERWLPPTNQLDGN